VVGVFTLKHEQVAKKRLDSVLEMTQAGGRTVPVARLVSPAADVDAVLVTVDVEIVVVVVVDDTGTVKAVVLVVTMLTIVIEVETVTVSVVVAVWVRFVVGFVVVGRVTVLIRGVDVVVMKTVLTGTPR
jgi:hypothetical protein